MQIMMCLDHCSTLTEHYRQMFRFGYHPTATRAVMLLRISCFDVSSYHATTANNLLCPFTTEDVLSFCVDTAQVLVVDISEEYSDLSSSEAPTALVVDDHHESRQVARIEWSERSPNHFIFTSMSDRRAFDWVQHWVMNDEMATKGLCIDMHETYSDECDLFNCALPSENLVELTLPATISARSTADDFLSDYRRLRFLDMSALSNMTQIGDRFLNNNNNKNNNNN
eukprot:PhM_4_TR17378/c2_g3_i4/m.73015